MAVATASGQGIGQVNCCVSSGFWAGEMSCQVRVLGR